MTTYAALLRGINVGGSRKLPMAGLRALMGELGLGDVRTHLQSGQAVFTAEDGDEEALAARIGAAVEQRFGFPVDVLVRDHAYLRAVVEACPFPAAALEPRQLHVTYFSAAPGPARYDGIDRAAFLPEEFRLGDRALYLYAPDGIGRSRLAQRLSGAGSDKDLIATSRNWNTAVRLVELTAG
ncbi:DUF1697 domain-containing protein [Streptomyces sp. NPDC003703]|uniref:DUF1697 domain-containing protein n=1 Tax=Streptomyces sp. NPDC003283 TaxID=3364681 RepID=UPI00367F8010